MMIARSLQVFRRCPPLPEDGNPGGVRPMAKLSLCFGVVALQLLLSEAFILPQQIHEGFAPISQDGPELRELAGDESGSGREAWPVCAIP